VVVVEIAEEDKEVMTMGRGFVVNGMKRERSRK
jgi:hypothetical protein